MGPGSLFKAGEMLHHGDLQKKKVSERAFVASMMQRTMVSMLE